MTTPVSLRGNGVTAAISALGSQTGPISLPLVRQLDGSLHQVQERLRLMSRHIFRHGAFAFILYKPGAC
jgi:hypothetical protein